MGIPLPNGGGDSTRPPKGDRANAVIQGTFTAAGQVSQPFPLYGAFNVVMYGAAGVNLITAAGSATATVQDNNTVLTGLTLAAGMGVASAAVPPGTTLGAITTTHIGGFTTVQLGGLTTAQVGGLTTATTAATLTGIGITPTASIALERSFDGGATWIVCGVGGLGQPAVYDLGPTGITNPVSFVVADPEFGVNYRLNVLSLSGVPLNYRISTSGGAALAWSVNVG